MSDRVVDESNPDNYLSTKDVHSLWDEEDLLKVLPYKEWDIQGCVEKCKNLGDHVRVHSVPRVILTFKISNMKKFGIFRTLMAWVIIGYIQFFPKL